MIAEIFIALIKAGIPISVSSYLLVWWAMKHNYLGEVNDLKGFEKEVKRLRKAKSSSKKKKKGKETESVYEKPHKMNPVHNKWLAFGGGFYGLVGLLTYLLVELGEIIDFVSNLGGFFAMLSNISIDLFIGFIINSIMNFVAAIAWPAYWMNEIHSEYIWIWFVMAYLSYLGGSRYALHQARQIKP